MASIDSLPFVDMTTLTQSELRALSLCSASAFDLNRLDDVVIPTIDRSIFNESAGSRRQTFSRPTGTATTHHHHHIRHRIPVLPPSSKHHHQVSSLPPHLDPDHLENRSIINSLKQYLTQSPQFQDVVPFFGTRANDNNDDDDDDKHVLMRKRKRGRKPKTKVKSLEENLVMVNKNGSVVDIVGLGSLEDPYGEELRRRTEGISANEEALLGFLRDLGGQWCSRRKKRKIVDADLLGDTLPVGWKLLLGLKRREGRASVYCRRYISPGGQHFVSCKEVSGYLQSYFGLNDTNQSINPGGDEMQQDYRVATDSLADIAQKENDQRQSNQQDKEVTLLGIDNLAEVQVRDLFECHKCEMTFDEKDTYLQHLLSFHQRTTRRYRLGSSVGDGVIIKDGKFECQFCHKVFHERRRYNGHVGIHVRNYVRGIEEPHGRLTLQKRTESPIRDEFPTRISKMDALIEIAQNSILETSTGGPNNEPVGGSAPDKLNVVSNSELLASFSDHELTSDNSFTEPEIDDAKFDTNMDELSDQQIIENMVTTEKMKKMDDADAGCLMDVKVEACVDTGTSIPADEQNGCKSEASDGKDGLAFIADEIDKSGIERESGAESCSLAPSINQNGCPVENNVNLGCLNTVEPGEPDEVNNNKNIRVEACSGSSNVEPADEKLSAAVEENLKENLLQYGVSETSMSLLEPSHGFLTTNAVSNKVEDEAHRIEQRHPNVTGFDDLRLDEIENMKFSFGTGQESGPLPEAPIQMSNNAGMDGSYGSSTHVESEVLLNSTSRHHLTTLCVWCGMEFSHEVVDSEMQPDSVGYMCPTCKAKISGQLGGLGSS